jgi:hypothetical protein
LLLQARKTLAPLLARSLADFRPIPALAPVLTFLLAPAGEDDPGSPSSQISSCLQAYASTGSCHYHNLQRSSLSLKGKKILMLALGLGNLWKMQRIALGFCFFMTFTQVGDAVLPIAMPTHFNLSSSLKVHKNENFFSSDFEFCATSLLVMRKY